MHKSQFYHHSGIGSHLFRYHSDALLAALLLILLTACRAAPTPVAGTKTPASTSTSTSTRAPSATFTRLPPATATQPPTQTPKPSSTATRRPTLLPTYTPSHTSTPRPAVYIPSLPSAKPVLIAYIHYGGDGGTIENRCLMGINIYRFVLYEDGRFIYRSRDKYHEAFLSDTEIRELFAQIEKTGFFTVNANDTLENEDPIYDNAPDVGEGGGGEMLIVKDRRIYIISDLRDYLIAPLKSTLNLLSNYAPRRDIHNYQYQYLQLMVFSETHYAEYEDIIPATPIPPVAAWPAELPPLAAYDNPDRNNTTLITGDILSGVLPLYPVIPGGRIFTDDGQTYYAVACPVLP